MISLGPNSVALSERIDFSNYHIQSAALFAKKAEQIEQTLTTTSSLEYRSFVIGSVISSFAFIEAIVNEVFADATIGKWNEKNTWIKIALKKKQILGLKNKWDSWNAIKEETTPIMDKYNVA